LKKPIRVLVVDDSALVRDILERGLSREEDILVVGKAPDVYIARDKIVFLKPDVVTLDVEMPRMDGVEFLRRLMPQHPLPVIMVSSLTGEGGKITLDALEAGALDFVTKPRSNVSQGLMGMIGELADKIRVAARTDISTWRAVASGALPAAGRPLSAGILAGGTDKVVAIGASTGGTVALRRIISSFPPDMPGTVVVQHMPPVFTRMFAESLDKDSAVEVKEAETGDRIIRGRVLIAPGDFHLRVARSGGQYIVSCDRGEKVNGHCPSVDVLFRSLAVHAGENAVGVVLTGMGADGAAGLREMRLSGARCFAQDEKTSVVFGMPREAFALGGAEKLVPLESVTREILGALAGAG